MAQARVPWVQVLSRQQSVLSRMTLNLWLTFPQMSILMSLMDPQSSHHPKLQPPVTTLNLGSAHYEVSLDFEEFRFLKSLRVAVPVSRSYLEHFIHLINCSSMVTRHSPST